MSNPRQEQHRRLVDTIPQVRLAGNQVALWPVRPEDYEFLYWIAVCDQNSYRWRFRGNIPSPEMFQSELHAGVLAHFVVHDLARERKVGYVVAYGADLNAGHVHVAAVMDPNHMYLGAGREGLGIFVRYLFDTWSLRTLYAEVPEYVVELFSETSKIQSELPFIEVGRFPDYLFHAGRFYEMVVFALSRKEPTA